MSSNASIIAWRHAEAEKGNQSYLMRRQRISIRFNSGEYGGRYVMINPCCFQYGTRSSHSSRLWMEALSTTPTVFVVSVRPNASQQAITTPVWIDCSNIEVGTSLWRCINPKTLIRPERLAGSAMTLLGSCQA